MMMKRIDNIVIGELVEGVTLEMLGVCDDEVTIHISEDDAREANFFLPRLLMTHAKLTSFYHGCWSLQAYSPQRQTSAAYKRTEIRCHNCVTTSVSFGAT